MKWIRDLYVFTIGFTVGTFLMLASLGAPVKRLEYRQKQHEEHLDRTIRKLEHYERIERWRSVYGRWVQIAVNPPDDPPPSGALDDQP